MPQKIYFKGLWGHLWIRGHGGIFRQSSWGRVRWQEKKQTVRTLSNNKLYSGDPSLSWGNLSGIDSDGGNVTLLLHPITHSKYFHFIWGPLPDKLTNSILCLHKQFSLVQNEAWSLLLHYKSARCWHKLGFSLFHFFTFFLQDHIIQQFIRWIKCVLTSNSSG